ncbi:5'-methylthioadenosine/S-adenosylhomocysteine nucleosidase [Gryllotalpicola ginsengisoli]|uniref:5'-methylthioadenosine/S-adenosylhomocysteine nucleosidase n=1 Tax=Gryllotalpicola ginsengisoli TaxID=444608 RepID=UPI0003B78690|nr:5'-methylthioadenosine/S-adenosylhomocysteine nucleosidase [Gryllotalpicola ginsengisoli]
MTDAPAPRAAILVAMEEEAQPFLDRAEHHGETFARERGHGMRRDLVIDGIPVALIRSGIGFANATAAAAYAFYTFGASVPLISAGTAGGLASGIRVGHVVVGERYVNMNADATAFGYSLGQVPGMPEHYAGDEELTARAIAAPHGDDVGTGVVGSSEVFVTEKRALKFREDFPDVVAVDMESAAIAQFAHTHGQAFVSVRAISDLCAPDGTEFLTHVDGAAERSADVVVGLLRALG